MRSNVHIVSKKKMRRLVISPYWDESERCKEPLSFTGVNDNSGKMKSEVFAITTFIAQPFCDFRSNVQWNG